MRIKDSPELFGNGMGSGTIGPIECEWCGELYNQDNEDPEGEIVDMCAETVEYTHFAGKQVCYCCFEKIENEILNRQEDVLTWLRFVHDARKMRMTKIDSVLVGAEQSAL